MANPFAVRWRQRLREACALEMATSAGLHGAFAFMLATAMASLDVSEREAFGTGDVPAMRDYLRAAAERSGSGDDEASPEPPGRGALDDERPRLSDAQPPLPGRAASPATPGARSGGQAGGRADDPLLAREALVREAQTFGIIGVLGGDTPASVWGDAPVGEGRIGDAWGEAIDGRSGSEMLLAGTGAGGGGRGEGIAIGAIGTIGHCRGGVGCGTGQGFGTVGGHGGLGGSHRVRGMTICGFTVPADMTTFKGCAAPMVRGRLPPEAIQRVVRQNQGRFRLCFEQALLAQPTLSGRIETKFVIGRDGSVTTASEGASDLPADVNTCVVRAFASLSFPKPEGGIVTVVYPLAFTSD
jgi:hypothetical protein